MQTIYDQLYFSAVAIATVDLTGKPFDSTGFVWLTDHGEQLLVTNRHVLEGARSITVRTVAAGPDGNPNLGVRSCGTILTQDVQWVAHPNPDVDVAVIAWAPFVESMKETFSSPCTVHFNPAGAYGLGSTTYVPAIAEVFFVGFPAGIYDDGNEIPVARRGITATPVYGDYATLPAFLMDGPIMKGSSGSPVFFASDIPDLSNGSFVSTGTRFAFLGVVSSFKRSDDWGPDAERGTDLGVVFNAIAISETVQEYYRTVGS